MNGNYTQLDKLDSPKKSILMRFEPKKKEIKEQELFLFDKFINTSTLGKQLTEKDKRDKTTKKLSREDSSTLIPTKDISDVLGDQKKFHMLLSGINDPKKRQEEILKFFKSEKTLEETKETSLGFRDVLKESRMTHDDRIDFRTVLQTSRIDRTTSVVQVINTERDHPEKEARKTGSLRMVPEDQEVLVDLAQVLQNKGLSKAFEDFLKKEQNQHQFEFLRKLDLLKPITSNEISQEMAIFCNELFMLYLKPKSEKEINLDAESRADIMDKLKPQIGHRDYWRCSGSPKSIFTQLKNRILLEMKYESFMRFQNSTELLDVLKKINAKNRGSGVLLTPRLKRNSLSQSEPVIRLKK